MCQWALLASGNMSSESLIRAYRRKQVENEVAWLKCTTAGVIITTICNRRCPLCCNRDIVNNNVAHHFPVDEVVEDIRGLHRVGTVCLSGGEPTLHPEIERILALGREARGSSRFEVVTNGANLLKIAPATKYVDIIHLTIFSDSVVESNALAEEYRKVKPTNVELHLPFVRHCHTGGGPFPCLLLLDTLSVREGRVYTCCAGSGIMGAQSTELSVGWERRLLSVEAPCEGCFNGN